MLIGKDRLVVVLGGYGNTGKHLVKTLLKETSFRIAIAGRSEDKANECIKDLCASFSSEMDSHVDSLNLRNRLSFRIAAVPSNLDNAFDNAWLVIVLSKTENYILEVAESILEAGAHYLDFFPYDKAYDCLKSLNEMAKAKNLFVIGQCGFHPGLPAVLVRACQSSFDQMYTAQVGLAMSFLLPDSKPDDLEEIMTMIPDMKPACFYNGGWHEGYSHTVDFDFSRGFGRKPCYPMYLDEMRSLPETLGLKECGCFVASSGSKFLDYFVTSMIFAANGIKKGLGSSSLAKMWMWGEKKFCQGLDGVSAVLEATGEKNGQRLKRRIVMDHESIYHFTIMPGFSCIKQLWDGKLGDDFGVWRESWIVDPEVFICDLEKSGIHLESRIEQL